MRTKFLPRIITVIIFVYFSFFFIFFCFLLLSAQSRRVRFRFRTRNPAVWIVRTKPAFGLCATFFWRLSNYYITRSAMTTPKRRKNDFSTCPVQVRYPSFASLLYRSVRARSTVSNKTHATSPGVSESISSPAPHVAARCRKFLDGFNCRVEVTSYHEKRVTHLWYLRPVLKHSRFSFFIFLVKSKRLPLNESKSFRVTSTLFGLSF